MSKATKKVPSPYLLLYQPILLLPRHIDRLVKVTAYILKYKRLGERVIIIKKGIRDPSSKDRTERQRGRVNRSG